MNTTDNFPITISFPSILSDMIAHPKVRTISINEVQLCVAMSTFDAIVSRYKFNNAVTNTITPTGIKFKIACVSSPRFWSATFQNKFNFAVVVDSMSLVLRLVFNLIMLVMVCLCLFHSASTFQVCQQTSGGMCFKMFVEVSVSILQHRFVISLDCSSILYYNTTYMST